MNVLHLPLRYYDPFPKHKDYLWSLCKCLRNPYAQKTFKGYWWHSGIMQILWSVFTSSKISMKSSITSSFSLFHSWDLLPLLQVLILYLDQILKEFDSSLTKAHLCPALLQPSPIHTLGQSSLDKQLSVLTRGLIVLPTWFNQCSLALLTICRKTTCTIKVDKKKM